MSAIHSKTDTIGNRAHTMNAIVKPCMLPPSAEDCSPLARMTCKPEPDFPIADNALRRKQSVTYLVTESSSWYSWTFWTVLIFANCAMNLPKCS